MFPETFSTARLTLRPIRSDDVAAIFNSYAQDCHVARFLTWRPHTSTDDTERFVQSCLNAQTCRTYVVIGTATDAIIGAFDLRQADETRLEVGYALARPDWGKGLMTEVLTEVTGWALRQPSIWRIGAVADMENIASMRVMEKAGMQREGVLRRWLLHPNVSDVPRDCACFSATR